MADQYGTVLNARHRDTAATVELMLGSPAVALQMLESVLSPGPGDPRPEPEPLAQCLLTAAQAHRALGDLGEAQKTLDRLTAFCEVQQLNGMLLLGRLEQSQLYAADGRYQEAYEEHRAFHATGEALRSTEREARAAADAPTFCA